MHNFANERVIVYTWRVLLVVESCFHVSVCKSCLLQRLEHVTSCPTCGVQLQRSRLAQQLRLDHAIQLMVYTAVPGLWHEEQRRRKHFVDNHPLSEFALLFDLLSSYSYTENSFNYVHCKSKNTI